MRMNPRLARQVHDMRGEHKSYSAIHKVLGISTKRSTMQGYYYGWLKSRGIKPWGIEQ